MTHISNRPEGVAGAVLRIPWDRSLAHDLISEYNATREEDEAELLSLIGENRPGDALIDLPFFGRMDAVDSRPTRLATRSFPIAG